MEERIEYNAKDEPLPIGLDQVRLLEFGASSEWMVYPSLLSFSIPYHSSDDFMRTSLILMLLLNIPASLLSLNDG
ncbi:hypothetical protein D1872_294790 [compost metagenome]